MFLDRDTIIQLLDETDKEYESNLLLLKMLPPDTVFEIVVEDIVTAEYYDKARDILYSVKISYDYFPYGKEVEKYEEGKLSRSIEESIQSEMRSVENHGGDNDSIMFTVLVSLLLMLFCLGLWLTYVLI